jgi:hypothetical protein
MSEPSLLERALAWLEQTWAAAPPTLRRRWPLFIAGGALLGFLVVLLVRWAAPGPVSEHAPAEAATEGAAGAAAEDEAHSDGTPPNAPPTPRGNAPVLDAGAPLSPIVKLTFRTFPARRASVMWGAKRLGYIDRSRPLVIERVRDSGPLDVVVRADGFIPVHARAYTFNDANIDVKITPFDKMDTLYGYQQPLGDAGAPL